MKYLIEPLSRRIGTMIGTMIATMGYHADVAQVEAAVALLSGIALDLALSNINRLKRSQW